MALHPLSALGPCYTGRMFKKHDDGAARARVEALADALVLVMFSDRLVASAESRHIAATLGEIGWSSPFDVKTYLQGAVARARKALDSDEATDAFVASLVERVPDEPDRAELLRHCRALAAADGDTADSELALIARIEAAFRA